MLTATGTTLPPPAVKLVVSPSNVLLDQPVRVRVSGLQPGQKIVLEAATKDTLGKSWRSHLVFRSSPNGVVDTHGGMRLFWGMEPVRKPSTPQPFFPAFGQTRVTIRAVAGRRTLASGAVSRRGTAAGVSRTHATLAAQGFVGTYFTPRAAPAGPAVLQLGGAVGGSGDFPAALLAGHGYRALSLAYFNEPGLPKTLKEIPLEYFAEALRWVAEQPGVDPHRVLIYGVGRGAEAALLLGATYPSLVRGVIASPRAPTCWAPIPARVRPGRSAANPFPRDRFRCGKSSDQVLALGGGKDIYYSSAYAVDEIVERAHEHGRHDIIGHVYPDAGAGVGFGIPYLPTYGRVIKLGNHYIGVGGLPGANARAWAASWPLVLDFIRLMPY